MQLLGNSAMNKNLLNLSIAFLLLSAGLSPAQTNEDMNQMFQDLMNDNQFSELFEDAFKRADLNSDGYVSEFEYSFIIQGIDFNPLVPDEQKKLKKKQMTKEFWDADANHDNRLNKTEYFSMMSESIAQDYDERLQGLKNAENKEEYVQKNLDYAQSVLALIGKTKGVKNTREFAGNTLSGMFDRLADSNYNQMDKNKDGCVDENEYVTYMNQNNEYLDATSADWQRLYKKEQKAKENCLTKEEYIRNFNNEKSKLKM